MAVRLMFFCSAFPCVGNFYALTLFSSSLAGWDMIKVFLPQCVGWKQKEASGYGTFLSGTYAVDCQNSIIIIIIIIAN